jgi:hypothetical protein
MGIVGIARMSWVTAFETSLERRGHGDREGNGEDGKEV